MSLQTEINALERRINAALERGNTKAAEDMTGALLRLKRAKAVPTKKKKKDKKKTLKINKKHIA